MSIVLTSGGPVKFPGLDLTIEHLIEGFYVFGIHISLSGILIALAMFLGLFITERLAKKTEQNTETYLDLAIRLVLAGIIGARAGHVVTHWQHFAYDQANVLNIRDGGMSFGGALVAGLLVSFIYCRQKKISWLQVCDTMLPGVVFGQMIGKVGEFFDRSQLGTYSDGLFAMQVDMASVDADVMKLGRTSSNMIKGNFLQVHPVTLYEIVLLVLLFLSLVILFRFHNLNGMILSVYLMVYGSIRFGLEFIRLSSVRMIGSPVSLEHMVALLFVVFGFIIFVDQIKKRRVIQKERPKNFHFSPKK